MLTLEKRSGIAAQAVAVTVLVRHLQDAVPAHRSFQSSGEFLRLVMRIGDRNLIPTNPRHAAIVQRRLLAVSRTDQVVNMEAQVQASTGRNRRMRTNGSLLKFDADRPSGDERSATNNVDACSDFPRLPRSKEE